MANTITRLTSVGNYYLSGTLDEVSGTYSTNGLIAHWPTYSKDFVAGKWTDIVNGNNMTFVNTPTYTTNNLFFSSTGVFATANSAYVANIPQLAGTSTVTIEGIIKIQSLNGGMIFCFNAYDVYTGGGNGLGFNTANSDNYGITVSQFNSLNLTGNWAHYTFVMQSSGSYTNNQIWINGVQQNLSQIQGNIRTNLLPGFNNGNGNQIPGSVTNANYAFYLNSSNLLGNYSMNNAFGGLRMYNRQLTPSEIVQNYNIAASNRAFGLTPIKPPTSSSLRLNTTTQNSASFLVNSLDEVTYNPIQTGYRKNLLNNSATPTSAAGGIYPWTGTFANTSVTLTTKTTDPVGTYTAYKFVSGISPVPQYVFWQQNFPGQYGSTYTYSMYVKAAEYNYLVFAIYDTASLGFYFNLTTGVFSGVSAGITYGSSYVGNGWWRIWVTRTFQNLVKNGQIFFNFNPAGSQIYAGDGVSGGYFWGPQLEFDSSPTIYEPTGLNGVPSSNVLSKLDSNGNSYLLGTYDEYTKGANIVQNGLIYYFDPAKPESWNGNTKVYDITGTQAPGTMVGNYTYSSEGGGTITLDAKTGYVDTGILGNNRVFTSNSEFTMSVWVKFTGKNLTLPMTSYAAGTIFGCFNFEGFGINWLNQGPNQTMYPGYVYGTFRIGSGATYATSGYAVTIGNTLNSRWLNFVWVYSGLRLANTNLLYVNTVTTGPNAGATDTAFNVIDHTGDKIQIGGPAISAGVNPGAGTLPGSLGQALIYNRALTVTEITQNFNEMRSQYGV